MRTIIAGGLSLPVILFSTHSKEGAYSTMKALALGAVDFIAKPADAGSGNLDNIGRSTHRKDQDRPVARPAGKRLRLRWAGYP